MSHHIIIKTKVIVSGVNAIKTFFSSHLFFRQVSLNTITNLDLIIEYYFYATFFTFSLLIKVLALLFNILYWSKASQAYLLGFNDFCIYFPVLINL